ncbi:MAG: thioredoxin domain-containing protein [Acidimicrobiia bacterium]
MPNRLAQETSPYLLQHQNNPVDWYPWGEEAREQARLDDKPILLSVGYSACHWCHVMAHESFENDETAALMNRLFINVKVDREERPDVDAIYMEAVQRLTGRGGWPMTVFLTPHGEPFFAGTYFPRDDRPGLPSFSRIMLAVADAWDNRRDAVMSQAERIVESIDRTLPPAPEVPDRTSLEEALNVLRGLFDEEHGGFGGAPKFPQEPVLEFLLRIGDQPWAPGALDMARATLLAMARGGIFDHVGGGFARYSVDRQWLIPHFEKMLYTNAQLARLYLRGWQVTGEERFRTVAVATLEYLERDLLLPGGGFASAEDADSEGAEGKFYVWSENEFRTMVGTERADLAGAYFGVSAAGNFEGANHLYEARSIEEVAADHGVLPADVAAAVAAARAKLLEARRSRIRPGLDDKVVTSWNGLAIRALAEAGAILDDRHYLDLAGGAARFLLENNRTASGRLLRSWGKGKPGRPGFSEDYATLAVGLFTLYQATGDPVWYGEAILLVEQLVELFAAPDGGFFTTGNDAEALITRPKDHYDSPHPSANSMAAEATLIASLYTGDGALRNLAEGAIRAGGRLIEGAPTGVGHLLAVLASLLLPPREVAIVGPDANRFARVVWERFRPDVALAVDTSGAAAVVPLLAGRGGTSATRAFVCRDFVCELPVSAVESFRRQLDG